MNPATELIVSLVMLCVFIAVGTASSALAPVVAIVMSVGFAVMLAVNWKRKAGR